jgi:hypothetical protein
MSSCPKCSHNIYIKFGKVRGLATNARAVVIITLFPNVLELAARKFSDRLYNFI